MMLRTQALRGPTLALLCVLALAAPPAAAAERGERGGEAGVLAGALRADESLSGASGGSTEPALGLRGGSVFADHWIWYVDGIYSTVATAGGLGDATTYTGRTGVEVVLQPESRLQWFATAGAGWMRVDYDRSAVADFHRPLVSAGIGQRVRFGDRLRFRWEFRGDITLGDPGLGGDDLSQALLLGGLIWGPGPSAGKADADGDGVSDRRDRCSGTPAGAVIDAHGCPLDSDGDGVPDGIDRCAGGRRGEPVDPTGCPLDQDGDGVPDGSDACAGSPRGSHVDDWGCPLDADHDGVPDGIDRCPATPAGAAVDAAGCSHDTDGDGVPDGIDRCDGTGPGERVGADGCPVAPAASFAFDEERGRLVLWLGFEPGDAALAPEAAAVLEQVLPFVLDTGFRFEIGGYTDSAEAGDDKIELEIARQRAEAVRDWLTSHGLEPRRLELRAYGAREPIDDESTVRGRSRNRRVELRRLD